MNGTDDRTPDAEYDALISAARALPRGIAPARDLWPEIESAIEKDAAAPARTPGWHWNRLLAQAAAVVLLVGGSSGVTWLVMKDDAASGASGGPTQALHFQSVAGSFGSRYHLGPEFVDARNNLAAGLDEKLEQLPPETRLAVEKNILDIRTAISEINLALANEPDNALLQDLLLSAYREELSLMKKVDGIANRAMRRTDI